MGPGERHCAVPGPISSAVGRA